MENSEFNEGVLYSYQEQQSIPSVHSIYKVHTSIEQNTIQQTEQIQNFRFRTSGKLQYQSDADRERLLIEIVSENSTTKNDEYVMELCTQYSGISVLKTYKNITRS